MLQMVIYRRVLSKLVEKDLCFQNYLISEYLDIPSVFNIYS